MQHFDRYKPPQPPVRSGIHLDAKEVDEVADLLRELRELTLSRGSFRACCDFLARYAGETDAPSLVPAEIR